MDTVGVTFPPRSNFLVEESVISAQWHCVGEKLVSAFVLAGFLSVCRQLFSSSLYFGFTRRHSSESVCNICVLSPEVTRLFVLADEV